MIGKLTLCRKSVRKPHHQDSRSICRVNSEPVTRADQHGTPARRRQDRTAANRTDARIKGGCPRSLLSCKYSSLTYRTIQTCTASPPSSPLIPARHGTRSRHRGRFLQFGGSGPRIHATEVSARPHQQCRMVRMTSQPLTDYSDNHLQ